MQALRRVACTDTQRVVQLRWASSGKSTVETIKEKIGEGLEKVGKAFESDGAVGKQFEDTKEGTVAGAAQDVGGPLDKHGEVGSKFKEDGPVGGRVEKAAEKVEGKGEQLKSEAKQSQASR
jgi:hypothetical protein